MPTFKEAGERATIDSIKAIIRSNPYPLGTNDDSAIIPFNGKDLVVAVDTVSKERHMPSCSTLEKFGWMSAAVSISDLAAMGAKPIGILSALSIPEDMEISEICEMMSGIDQCAEFAGTWIVGGDTKPGSLSISCTALGTMEGRKPMSRSGASDGDLIAVTGSLGNPAAGYYALKNNIECEDGIFSLCVPIPKVKEGILLSKSGMVTSCIDLSDGLSTALNHLCKASSFGATIEWDLLPIEDYVIDISEKIDVSIEHMVLEWGGEYELLFTFSKKDLSKMRDTGVDFHVIGVISDGGILLRCEGKYKEMGYGTY